MKKEKKGKGREREKKFARRALRDSIYSLQLPVGSSITEINKHASFVTLHETNFSIAVSSIIFYYSKVNKPAANSLARSYRKQTC